jgi:hypothetical protein
MGKSKDLARRVLLTGMIWEEERFVELRQDVFNASAHDNRRQAPTLLTKEINHEQKKDNQ